MGTFSSGLRQYLPFKAAPFSVRSSFADTSIEGRRQIRPRRFAVEPDVVLAASVFETSLPGQTRERRSRRA